MRRALVCFAILIGSLVVAAGQAAAQAPLPACTAADQLGDASDPHQQPVGLAGSLYTFSLAFTAPQRVTNVTMTYTGATGVAVSSVAQPTAAQMKLGIALPADKEMGRLTFGWDQDAGTPLACHAGDTLPFWVLDADTVPGDSAVPSLSGTYKIRIRPRNYRGRTVTSKLRVRPKCDIFACDVALGGGGELGYQRLPGADGVGDWVGVTGWATLRDVTCARYGGVVQDRYVYTLHSDEVTVIRVAGLLAPVVRTVTGSVREEFRYTARGRAHCSGGIGSSPRLNGVTGTRVS
jgi:hypothetical protein